MSEQHHEINLCLVSQIFQARIPSVPIYLCGQKQKYLFFSLPKKL